MNRKTNLFYSDGVDSNFVTFSNYTESLTGTCVSTDKKLFPSRFLCLYIPELSYNGVTDSDKKKEFIQNYLVAHYENKLAALRDDCISNNVSIDENVHSLKYLLKDIYFFDNTTEINYVGDVTEQDYNGIYTDTICIVDCNNVITGSINYNSNYDSDTDTKVTLEYNSKLYGWEHTSYLPYNYDNVTPMYDESNDDSTYGYYNYNNNITSIGLTDDSKSKTDIKFNVILTLYDVVNINYETNTNSITQLSVFNLDDIDSNYSVFLPMGMWFADTDIVLKRDSETNTNSSWSLVLSSQFKPFPYSADMNTELGENAYKDAFATYAKILSEQSTIIDKFNETITLINNLQSRVLKLESSVSNISSTYNIDTINKTLIDIQSDITNIKSKLNSSSTNNISWVDGDN